MSQRQLKEADFKVMFVLAVIVFITFQVDFIIQVASKHYLYEPFSALDVIAIFVASLASGLAFYRGYLLIKRMSTITGNDETLASQIRLQFFSAFVSAFAGLIGTVALLSKH